MHALTPRQLSAETDLRALFARRIAILDGAMGTMIQQHALTEADFRGERFRDHPHDLRGNNDLLCLTRPDLIQGIHAQYFAAGADLVETNTFSATVIAQADYKLEPAVKDLNLAAVACARRAADEAEAAAPGRRRYVAGAIGPLNRTLSLSPDVNRPDYRAVTWEQVVAAYDEQARALITGGVDVLLVETVFDTLNAKAALFAIENIFDEHGARLPVIVSVTITDLSGRTLSGQTTEAFYNSIRHTHPFCVGLNCALGPKQMRPFVEELARVAECFVSCYPNAGLPNAFGGYDETPDDVAGALAEFAAAGWLNLVGGCCGTTPAHIAAIAEAVAPFPPRIVPQRPPVLRLSGLEPLLVA
jgi:5-methyltetrahydrofolate--homocysteine methyltransferase